MTEKTIERSIRSALSGRGWWTVKIHGGPFQRAGLPDLLCVKDGHLLAIEVKQPGEEPTALQRAVLAELVDHGATAGWATSVDEALELEGETMTKKLLDVKEVAEKLSVSVGMVRKLARLDDTFPSGVQIGTRGKRWVEHEVDEWIDRQARIA